MLKAMFETSQERDENLGSNLMRTDLYRKFSDIPGLEITKFIAKTCFKLFLKKSHFSTLVSTLLLAIIEA